MNAGMRSFGSGPGTAASPLFGLPFSDGDYQRYRSLLTRLTGISLCDSKKKLLAGRLYRRLRQRQIDSFADYYRLINDDRAELQCAIDLLTTNETWFFREQGHFDFLASEVLPALAAKPECRVWSAACSSGDEAYSLAMLLAEQRPGRRWEIVASDLSTRMLEQAERAEYPLERARAMPRDYWQRYCRPAAESFTVAAPWRERLSFRQINLIEPLPALGSFDVIFLRNAMFYFDRDTKRQVVARIVPLLKPGGYFMVSHAESLLGLNDELKLVKPSIYRKPL
jgi:chemotaxis protein methyltransferase CheR